MAGLVVTAAMALRPGVRDAVPRQINLILLALILTDIWRVSRGHDAGIGVGIAAAIKLTPPSSSSSSCWPGGRRRHSWPRPAPLSCAGLSGSESHPTPRRCTGSTFPMTPGASALPYISNQSPYGTAIRIAEGRGIWSLVDRHPARVRRYRPRRGHDPGATAGLAGRDRGHRHHRAAGVADFLGASLGVDPARPGPAGALRAPDRRGRRVPAVRAGAVLVHAPFGRAA